MKPLNFTAKEKLSYLLNLKAGDEIQTIRKTWEKVKIIDEISDFHLGIDEFENTCPKHRCYCPDGFCEQCIIESDEVSA